MKQPWIHSKSVDVPWIIGPPYFTLALVFTFQEQIINLSASYNFMTWLILVVFIDVAHVYSSLFKTYFIKEEFNKHKTRYLTVPLVSFILGVLLHSQGSLLFWSILACTAVFHFVRQQYGIMRIYDRFERRRLFKIIDALAIYSATIYPMFYWFYNPRHFNWFLEHEFDWLSTLPNILPLFTLLYFFILGFWILTTTITIIQENKMNWPKILFIIGTFLSWYFGIVYFNNDLIFTMLNVISHGIPYVGLIYIKEIQQNPNGPVFFKIFQQRFGLLLFLLILMVFAFTEEFFWDILVWREHFNMDFSVPLTWQNIIVPLLVTPQLSHYILDGFIWRKPKV
jgi:hypothetical protein